MADLKTTYKDDLLDTSVNEKRKYNMIQNADGTVSFEDVTTYLQIGDSFGAADINSTNEKVNEVNSNLADGQISFSVVDGEPYVKVGADSPRPFSGNIKGYWMKPHDKKESITLSVPKGTTKIYIFSYFYFPKESYRSITKNGEVVPITEYISETVYNTKLAVTIIDYNEGDTVIVTGWLEGNRGGCDCAIFV